MTTEIPAAFWSYVHDDDEHERGRISRLRALLSEEVAMQTGTPFSIFHDRHDILWGQQWKQRITAGIDTVTILIPVLTPRYFHSKNCADEVETFLKRERDLGASDLILPLYYISASMMGSDSPSEIARVLSERQHVDWRQTRHTDLDSLEGRRALAELAERLVARLGDIPRTRAVAKATAVVGVADDPTDDEPGLLELLASAEEAHELLLDAVQGMTTQMIALTSVARESTAEVKRAEGRPKPSAAKLTIFKRMVDRLYPIAEAIEQHTVDYVEQLERVDAGISAMAELIPATDGAERTAAANLLGELRKLEVQADESLAAAMTLADALDPLVRLSQQTRPVLRAIHRNVTTFADSRPTFRKWVSLFENALGKS